MKKKLLIVALCITVPLFYFSYRIWNVTKSEPEIPQDRFAVTAGRYYLDDGKRQAYIDVSNCDAQARTFDMECPNMHLETLKEVLFLENYQTMVEGTVKVDENGEVILDEHGDLITYTVEECEQINRDEEQRIRNAIDAWCAESTHSYHYSEPTYLFTNADYYEELDTNDYNIYTAIIAFPDKIVFGEYMWKLDEAKESKS